MCKECNCKSPKAEEVLPDGMVEEALSIPGAILTAVGLSGSVVKTYPKKIKEDDWLKRKLSQVPQ